MGVKLWAKAIVIKKHKGKGLYMNCTRQGTRKSRIRKRSRNRRPPFNFVRVSERMSDTLIVELIENKEVPKEVKLRQIKTLNANIEKIQGYISELKKNISKSQGDNDLKELAWDGAKRVANDVSAYKTVLNEGAKYLEGKNMLSFPYAHTYKGTDSALLPCTLVVADSKSPAEMVDMVVALLMQEFWSSFFNEAQGRCCSKYCITSFTAHNFSRYEHCRGRVLQEGKAVVKKGRGKYKTCADLTYDQRKGTQVIK